MKYTIGLYTIEWYLQETATAVMFQLGTKHVCDNIKRHLMAWNKDMLQNTDAQNHYFESDIYLVLIWLITSNIMRL